MYSEASMENDLCNHRSRKGAWFLKQDGERNWQQHRGRAMMIAQLYILSLHFI
jgi:hypothetical protein